MMNRRRRRRLRRPRSRASGRPPAARTVRARSPRSAPPRPRPEGRRRSVRRPAQGSAPVRPNTPLTLAGTICVRLASPVRAPASRALSSTPPMHISAPPGASGLYDPANEHDACGIALVAKLWGEASHAVVEKALDALGNLEHRGAEGADPNTGDGAGILLQVPDAFLRAVAGVELPPPGRYAVGVIYLPPDPERRLVLEQMIEETIEAEGQRVVCWRDVPVDERHVGDTARLAAPRIRQVMIEAAEDLAAQDA